MHLCKFCEQENNPGMLKISHHVHPECYDAKHKILETQKALSDIEGAHLSVKVDLDQPSGVAEMVLPSSFGVTLTYHFETLFQLWQWLKYHDELQNLLDNQED